MHPGPAAPTGVPGVPVVPVVRGVEVEGSRVVAVPVAAVVVEVLAPVVAGRPVRVAAASRPEAALRVRAAVPAAAGEGSPAAVVLAVVGEGSPVVVVPVVVRAAASPVVAVPVRSSGRGARRSAVAARS